MFKALISLIEFNLFKSYQNWKELGNNSKVFSNLIRNCWIRIEENDQNLEELDPQSTHGIWRSLYLGDIKNWNLEIFESV